MNLSAKMKVGIGFGAGVICGAIVAGIGLKIWFQRAFDKELEEERAILRRRIARKASRTASEAPRSDSTGSDVSEHMEGSEGLRKASRVVIRDNGYIDESRVVDGLSGEEESLDDEDREWRKELRARMQQEEDDRALEVREHEDMLRARLMGDGQQIEITEDEFVENEWEYEKYNLNYFVDDDTLCDDQEEVLQLEDWFDRKWLDIWEHHGEPAFYIVDHKRERVIEVLINLMAYHIWHDGGEDE